MKTILILLCAILVCGCVTKDGELKMNFSIPLGEQAKYGLLRFAIGYVPPEELIIISETPLFRDK